MELDAVTVATRPWTRLEPGKGKTGGTTTTPTGRRQVEGWWMRPCRHCSGGRYERVGGYYSRGYKPPQDQLECWCTSHDR
eukprot:2170460-Heterocapsa_arctica.AAC.1